MRPTKRPPREGIISIPLEFECDPRKSIVNMAKHGIDFLSAQEIWRDRDRLEIPARSADEPRSQVLGRIGAITWSAFITYRGEVIRIISVRRARREERKIYENG